MKLAKLIKNDVLSIMSFQTCIFSVIIFVCIFICSISYNNNLINNLGGFDILFLVFCGPKSINFNILDVMKLLTLNCFFFYVLAVFLDWDLKYRSIYSIPRVEYIDIWLNGRIFSILIFSFLYCIIGFATVSLILIIKYPITNVYNKLLFEISSFTKSNCIYISINMFLLIALSFFLIGIIQFCVTVITKSSMVSFIVTILFSTISIYVGYINNHILKWLPLNQGIIIRHDSIYNINLFSFEWSYLYIILASAFVIFILKVYIHKKGIFY